MGGRNEDNPAHFWHRLVAERLLQKTAVIGRSTDLVDGPCADGLPEPRSTTLDHHLRQDAAQAVADDDHPVEGRVRALGIEDPPSPLQGLPQQVGRERDGVAAGIAERPELVLAPECGVVLEILDHPVPKKGTAPEAMDQDDGDLARLIGPAHAEPTLMLARPDHHRAERRGPDRTFLLIRGTSPATLSEARIITTPAVWRQRGAVIIESSFWCRCAAEESSNPCTLTERGNRSSAW